VIDVRDNHDALLCQRLEALTESKEDYWSFRGNSRREYGHGLFQYPAMMVPQLAGIVLAEACAVHPDIGRVCDPFAGSGTIMTESMFRGLSFTGCDINPLAILLCRVKSGPFFMSALEQKVQELLGRINGDKSTAVEINFPNIDKWFEKDVQQSLSRLRRSILLEKSGWARRFFWVALAETVRLTSNSRTSTFKLHIRTEENIASRQHDAIGMFKKALERNVEHYRMQEAQMSESGLMMRGRYSREVEVLLSDAADVRVEEQCDMLVTSPPYGDNTSTVPYGQYSYLPLQWIDLRDIDPKIDPECLRTTQEIDRRSLGGCTRVTKEEQALISSRSPKFADYIQSLASQPPDRANRVTAFIRDLEATLGSIMKMVCPGGIMVWILGNRKVGGQRVPFDAILSELLTSHGAKRLCQLTRRISSKRMAFKNSIADTMSRETILVMRKGE